MGRHNYYHCNVSYDDDNLDECARWLDDVYWKCGIFTELPELAPGYCSCDLCLRDVGREDLLKGTIRGARPSGEELAIARILTAYADFDASLFKGFYRARGAGRSFIVCRCLRFRNKSLHCFVVDSRGIIMSRTQLARAC